MNIKIKNNIINNYLLILDVPMKNKIFSIVEITGTIIKKYAKYKNVAICPTNTNGTSTWHIPILPNNTKLNTNKKKKNFDNTLNVLPLTILLSVNGKTNNTKIAPNIVITPNNLSGIDLKIA